MINNGESIYWALYNNEIRLVTYDDESSEVIFTTVFRSIKNKMYFGNVIWKEDVTDLVGHVLSYVEQVKPDEVPKNVWARICKEYRDNPSAEFLENVNLHIYHIVCDNLLDGMYLIAGNVSFTVNG